MGPAQIAVVGPATAAKVREYGLRVNLEAHEKTGRGLATELGTILSSLPGKHRVLWPHGNLADPVMSHELIGRGIECVGLEVYHTLPDPAAAGQLRSLLESGASLDGVIFASGSAVDSFFRLGVPLDHSRTRFITIGPETSRKLRGHGIGPFSEAAEPTPDALIDCVLGEFSLTPPAQLAREEPADEKAHE
ncbi:uroporphyrinogen-III synthase [Oscillatoria laete-virens NRMC-F 0139]|nr:uroporphyrinogen-III synthase [Oscillatoria laete-virens NRMC-F 0139]